VREGNVILVKGEASFVHSFNEKLALFAVMPASQFLSCHNSQTSDRLLSSDLTECLTDERITHVFYLILGIMMGVQAHVLRIFISIDIMIVVKLFGRHFIHKEGFQCAKNLLIH
jgi:hypothetical protein